MTKKKKLLQAYYFNTIGSDGPLSVAPTPEQQAAWGRIVQRGLIKQVWQLSAAGYDALGYQWDATQEIWIEKVDAST